MSFGILLIQILKDLGIVYDSINSIFILYLFKSDLYRFHFAFFYQFLFILEQGIQFINQQGSILYQIYIIFHKLISLVHEILQYPTLLFDFMLNLSFVLCKNVYFILDFVGLIDYVG